MSDDNNNLEEPNEIEDLDEGASPAEGSKKEQVPDEWDSLSGKSKERFKELSRMKNEFKSEVEELRSELNELRSSRQTDRVPMPDTSKLSPQEEAAIRRLKEVGAFATPDDVRAEIERLRAEEQKRQDRMMLDQMHDSLEKEFSSDGDLPAYDRAEVEEHMRAKGIYDPKAAYRDLYWDEITKTKAQKLSGKDKQPVTQKTKSRISTGQPWTPEALQERLQQPDGRQFYLKNKEKITRLMGQWGQS